MASVKNARPPLFPKPSPPKRTTLSFRLRDFPGFSRADLEALQTYYHSRLEGQLSPEKRVGWNTAQGQRVRFEALASVGPLKGARVLDIGCGLGAFWGYLRAKKAGVDYRGVDLFPDVIREAKKLYPDARFESRLLLSRPYPAGSFDYCFLSGVFNVRVKDNWRYMKAVLSSALGQSRRAVAFNVLNAEAGLDEPDRFAAHPKRLAAFGKSLGASRVHLIDHYHHLDLTLFLYK